MPKDNGNKNHFVKMAAPPFILRAFNAGISAGLNYCVSVCYQKFILNVICTLGLVSDFVLDAFDKIY